MTSPVGHGSVKAQTSGFGRKRKLSVAAAAVGCAGLIGLGATAVSGTTTTPTEAAAPASAAHGGAKSESACNLAATLTQGVDSPRAAAEAARRATSTVSYGDVAVSVLTAADRTAAGAMVAEDTYLFVTANAEREREVMNLVRTAVDNADELSVDGADMTLNFANSGCDFSLDFDEDLTFRDVLNSDIMLTFDTDEGPCHIRSRMDNGDEQRGLNLGDLDPSKLGFSFNAEDGNFTVGVTAARGEFGFSCANDEQTNEQTNEQE